MNNIQNGLVGIVALLGLSAHAETLAWYHFDEQEPGTRCSSAANFLNAMDASKYPGYFRVWKPASPYYNPPSVVTTPAERLPEYAVGFQSGDVKVYDPVSGQLLSNVTSIHLCSEDRTQAYNVYGSLAMIDDCADFHLQTFTLEFFLKIPSYSLNLTRTIMRKGSAMSMTMNSDGILSAAGGGATVSTGKKVNDGKWHHIALVADGDNGTLTVYVDGVAKAGSMTGSIDYSGNKPLSFGGTPDNYYGIWDGQVDEIRISNEVLGPSQFLAYRVNDYVSEASLPNTLMYLDFAGGLTARSCDEFPTTVSYTPSLINRASGVGSFAPSASIRWVSGQTANTGTYSLTADGPNESLRGSLANRTFASNEEALHVGTNAANPSASIPRIDINDTGRVIASDSFTIEFFLKIGTGGIAVGADSTTATYVMQQINTMTLRMEGNGSIAFQDGIGSKMYFPVAWNDSHDRTAYPYNDGKWHHYALVYDKSIPRVDLYIDYDRKGYLENPNLSAAWTQTDRQLGFLGFYYNSDTYRFKNATIDEIRITRGALGPWMFLTSRAVEGGSALGFASFDGSLALTPYADFFPAPVATAATCDRARAGSLIHDGKDGALLRERNRGSVRIQGGQVVYPKNGLAGEAEEVTVEFFAKVGTAAAGAGLVRLNRASESKTGAASWAISLANADGELAVALDTDAATDVSHTFGGAIADGQWHHVAVTLAKDGADTRVTVYRDYVSLGSQVYAGRLLSRFHEANLMLGGGATDGFDGWIDELRVTPGVLTADAFLTAESRGLSLILR